MRAFALFFAIVLGAVPLAAHEPGEKARQAVKQAVDGAVDQVQAAARQAETIVQAAPMDVLKESLSGHWHNKLVHFPVALGVFGCLFFIACLRWPSYLGAARVLLVSALVLGVAALRTGEGAAMAFMDSSFEATLLWHERAAQAMLALLALTLLLSYFPSFKKWSWVVAVLACGAVVLAGALGGALGSA